MENTLNNGIQDEMLVDLEGCLVQVEASRAWFNTECCRLSNS